MTIDNKITRDRVKKVLKPTLIVVLVVAVVMGCFFTYYLLSLPSPKEKLTIWVGSTELDYSEKLHDDVLEYASQYGITHCSFVIRNPDDFYYDTAFSLSGYYSADVFILDEKQIESYQETALFMPLNVAEGYRYQDEVIGIPLTEELYVLLNYRSDKDADMLMDVAQFLIQTINEDVQ